MFYSRKTVICFFWPLTLLLITRRQWFGRSSTKWMAIQVGTSIRHLLKCGTAAMPQPAVIRRWPERSRVPRCRAVRRTMIIVSRCSCSTAMRGLLLVKRPRPQDLTQLLRKPRRLPRPPSRSRVPRKVVPRQQHLQHPCLPCPLRKLRRRPQRRTGPRRSRRSLALCSDAVVGHSVGGRVSAMLRVFCFCCLRRHPSTARSSHLCIAVPLCLCQV
mmetsp:Transcript_23981/g.58214  ORF Transcript_23981/g.58214 Transcript_23981/m.58214 type:complete len:215 (-) Transcript_23981:1-645(-)